MPLLFKSPDPQAVPMPIGIGRHARFVLRRWQRLGASRQLRCRPIDLER